MQVMELAQQVMELAQLQLMPPMQGMHCRRNPSVLTACSSISSPASLSTVLSTAETRKQPGLLRATHTGFSLRDFSPPWHHISACRTTYKFRHVSNAPPGGEWLL